MRVLPTIPGSASKALVAHKSTQKERKEKLSIYMMRSVPADENQLIKVDDAKPPVKFQMKEATANLYVRHEGSSEAPPWTLLFREHQSLPDDLFGVSSSVGAVLIVRAHGKVFILSFGTGYHLIRQSEVERDFGLRVTLNSVDPIKLRSLDKAAYENNSINSRVQSTTEVDIFQLQTDSETDMVFAVTGVSSYPLFGTTVTGRDALTINVAATLDGIAAVLELALDRYCAALPAEFDWMDNVNRVRGAKDCADLDDELDKLLGVSDFTTMNLGEPEIVDWERQIGYAFDRRAKTSIHPVLQLKDLCAYLVLHKQSFTTLTLKATSVHVIDNEYQSTRSWSAYQCLLAEVDHKGNHYILRAGVWYKVNTDYVKHLDKALSGIPMWPVIMPLYNHKNEEDYNAHVPSTDPSFANMDQKFIHIGGPKDKVESCDLVRGAGEFVHVKYYRSSATLSHLFAQGVVSMEAMLADERYRVELNKLLPPIARFVDPLKQPDRTKFRVVFGIATRKTLPKELPFFSKVTLRQAMRTFNKLGIDLALSKIDVDPTLYVSKLVKPKAAVKRKTK